MRIERRRSHDDEQKKKTGKAGKVSLEKPNIDATLEKVEEVKRSPRKVRLVVRSCCGCGCSNVDIERMVEWDSPLQDGDKDGKLKAGDKTL